MIRLSPLIFLFSLCSYGQYIAPSYSFVDYDNQVGVKVGYLDTTFSYTLFYSKGHSRYAGGSIAYMMRPYYEGKTDVGFGLKYGLYDKNVVIKPYMECWFFMHKYLTFRIDILLLTRFDLSFAGLIPLNYGKHNSIIRPRSRRDS